MGGWGGGHPFVFERMFYFIVALRPWKRDGLLGTGTEWEGDDRVKARPRKPSEKQWKC